MATLRSIQKMAWNRRRKQKWVAAGLCRICGREATPDYKSCASCREKGNLKSAKFRKDETRRLCNRAYSKQRRLNNKIAVMQHYGGKCACCGEANLGFLTLDHINNDGVVHRKVTGMGARFYEWILKNGFPTDLQVLCFNCNCGRAGHGGICPHKIVTVNTVFMSPKLSALKAKEKSLQSSFVQPAASFEHMN
jgi:hypothetical protein